MYSLKESDVSYLCAAPERATFFDAVASVLGADTESTMLAANYIVSDLAGVYAKRGKEEYAMLDPIAFAKLIRLVASHTLSSRGAKDTLLIWIEKGGNPEIIAKEHNLIQIHDAAALGTIVDAILAREEKAVQEYKSGKQAALQYLVGKAMKESRGAGNPLELQKLIIQKLH